MIWSNTYGQELPDIPPELGSPALLFICGIE